MAPANLSEAVCVAIAGRSSYYYCRCRLEWRSRRRRRWVLLRSLSLLINKQTNRKQASKPQRSPSPSSSYDDGSTATPPRPRAWINPSCRSSSFVKTPQKRLQMDPLEIPLSFRPRRRKRDPPRRLRHTHSSLLQQHEEEEEEQQQMGKRHKRARGSGSSRRRRRRRRRHRILEEDGGRALKATYNKIRPDFSLDQSGDSTRCESLFSSYSCEQNRPSDDASDLFQELVWAFVLLKAVKLLFSSLLFLSLRTHLSLRDTYIPLRCAQYSKNCCNQGVQCSWPSRVGRGERRRKSE